MTGETKPALPPQNRAEIDAEWRDALLQLDKQCRDWLDASGVVDDLDGEIAFADAELLTALKADGTPLIDAKNESARAAQVTLLSGANEHYQALLVKRAAAKKKMRYASFRMEYGKLAHQRYLAVFGAASASTGGSAGGA